MKGLNAGDLLVAPRIRPCDKVERCDPPDDVAGARHEVSERRGHVGLGHHRPIPALLVSDARLALSHDGEVVGPTKQLSLRMENEVHGLDGDAGALGDVAIVVPV